MAPVVSRFIKDKRFRPIVAVSAQHRQMLDQVLRIFKIKSQIDLDIMRKNQTLFDITNRVLSGFQKALKKVKPDLVMVHGDTTTTLGGALAAYYQQIPVAHVEAGLRTRDKYRPFPEEMNRHLTDAIASLHLAPTRISEKRLLQEKISKSNIFVTGNTVIDALLQTARKNIPIQNKTLGVLLKKLQLHQNRIILLTAHRRENFGIPFTKIFGEIVRLSRQFPHIHWIYPVHPNPNVHGPAHKRLGNISNVHLFPPLSYSDLVGVMKRSTLVVTDSGGLQEEAPSLGKPVLVLRDVTERPEAISAGTVRLAGIDGKRMGVWVRRLLKDNKAYQKMANAVNPYGDGKASERILQATKWYFGMTEERPDSFKS